MAELEPCFPPSGRALQPTRSGHSTALASAQHARSCRPSCWVRPRTDDARSTDRRVAVPWQRSAVSRQRGRGGPGWRRCGAAGSIRASALSGAGEQRGQEAPSSSSGQVGGRGCGLSRREAAVFALTLPGGRQGGLSCSFLLQRHDEDLFLLKEI